MPIPTNLHKLLKSKSLVAWWPFEEVSHTTGYTPNVADETDSSPNRLQLNNFITGDICGDGVLTMIEDPSSGDTESPATSDVQITGDFTAIIWFKWNDEVGNEGIMFTVSGYGSELEADNTLIYIRQNSDGTIRLVHEYGVGLNEAINTVVADPRDSSINFFMIKRDTVNKKYYVSINNGTVYEYSYTNNPTGGTTADVTVSGPPGSSQCDGDYYDVYLFDEILTANEITTMYESGISESDWFNYDNWNSASGTGYVEWNPECISDVLLMDNILLMGMSNDILKGQRMNESATESDDLIKLMDSIDDAN